MSKLGPRAKEYLGIDDRDIVIRMREREAAEHPLSYARDARDAAAEIERLRAALRMGLQLGESGKHGDGPSCPTCHFVREARKALNVEQTGDTK